MLLQPILSLIEPTDEMLGQTVVTVQSRPQSSTKSVEKVLVLSKKELDSRSVFNLRGCADAANECPDKQRQLHRKFGQFNGGVWAECEDS